MARRSLLLVSDLAYPARGRRYGDEDVWLSSRLRDEFDTALCSPLDATALMDGFDIVLVRNSGPVMGYREAHAAFRAAARRRGTVVVNPLDGRGDMSGKQYLIELTSAGEPVVPTVGRVEDIGRLPPCDEYVVKPRDGADSIGLRLVSADALGETSLDDTLIQPRVAIAEEVSFVFVGRSFVYALRTRSAHRRWDLEPWSPTAAELRFAQRFVDWNTLAFGVQRVDACRTSAGELLLMELEDLNPYLSLDVLAEGDRERFVRALLRNLQDALAARAPSSRTSLPSPSASPSPSPSPSPAPG